MTTPLKPTKLVIEGKKTRKRPAKGQQLLLEEQRKTDLPVIDGVQKTPTMEERLNTNEKPPVLETLKEETEDNFEEEVSAVKRKRVRQQKDPVDFAKTVAPLTSVMDKFHMTMGRFEKQLDQWEQRLTDIPILPETMAKPVESSIPNQPVTPDAPGADRHFSRYLREEADRQHKLSRPPPDGYEFPPVDPRASQYPNLDRIQPFSGPSRLRPSYMRTTYSSSSGLYPDIPENGMFHAF